MSVGNYLRFPRNTFMREGDIVFMYHPTASNPARMDIEDALRVSMRGWHEQKSQRGLTYYRTNGTPLEKESGITYVSLHHFILGIDSSVQIDHRDGDVFNFQRRNLRVSTPAQNSQNRKTPSTNTTGIKGVFYDGVSRRKNPWRVIIQANGVRRYIGIFPTLKAAAAARKTAEQKYHGEFARP